MDSKWIPRSLRLFSLGALGFFRPKKGSKKRAGKISTFRFGYKQLKCIPLRAVIKFITLLIDSKRFPRSLRLFSSPKTGSRKGRERFQLLLLNRGSIPLRLILAHFQFSLRLFCRPELKDSKWFKKKGGKDFNFQIWLKLKCIPEGNS